MLLRRSFLAAAAAAIPAGARTSVAPKTGYVPANGPKLYYEIHGAGRPLILLHGGLGAAEMFRPILPLLANHCCVIAVDLLAHGRTADIDRPLSIAAMADDIAALIQYLKIDKAAVIGYSLSGLVAMRTAIQHPELVTKLLVISAACKRDGWYPEITAGMTQLNAAAAESMKQTPMYRLYARVAPKPTDWPVLLSKAGDLFRKNYDYSKEVAAIKTLTLLAFGDADAVRTAHAVELFELLGGGKKDGGWDGSGISNGRLAILPGLTHYTIFSSPALAAAVTPFLDVPNHNEEKS